MGTRNLYHLSKQLKWNMEQRWKILLRTGSPQQGPWVRSQCWVSHGKGYEQGCGNTVLLQLSVCSRLMPAGFMKERSRAWWPLQWSPACYGLHSVLGGLEILPTSMLSSIRKKAVAELILKKFQILWVLQGRMPPSSVTSEGGGVTCSFGSSFGSFPTFSSVQSLSHVRLFATPWIAARQASLSITNSWSSPRLTSIESVMLSNHLILCRPLLLLPPIPPSIRVFSNESTLHMRWPKYWSFSF